MNTTQIFLTDRQIFVLRAVLVYASSNVDDINCSLGAEEFASNGPVTKIEVGGDVGNAIDDELDGIFAQLNKA